MSFEDKVHEIMKKLKSINSNIEGIEENLYSLIQVIVNMHETLKELLKISSKTRHLEIDEEIPLNIKEIEGPATDYIENIEYNTRLVTLASNKPLFIDNIRTTKLDISDIVIKTERIGRLGTPEYKLLIKLSDSSTLESIDLDLLIASYVSLAIITNNTKLLDNIIYILNRAAEEIEKKHRDLARALSTMQKTLSIVKMVR